MAAAALRLLIAGPAGGALLAAAAMAAAAGAEVVMAGSVEAALAELAQGGADAALVDLALDLPRLMAGLAGAGNSWPPLPVFACGIDVTPALAVAAIRAGARDFVPLPPDPAMIAATLGVMTSRRGDLIGEAPAFATALTRAAAFAASAAPLLISGETGTGRETLARHVHGAGHPGRFLCLDCTGLTPDRADGWFAAPAGQGPLNAAQGGTLCLREPGLLPLPVQHRLCERLAVSFADTRLITLSSIDLDAAVGTGRFSPSLLIRLGALRVTLPPLRARAGDVLRLARHFAARHAEMEGLPRSGIAPDIAPAAADRLAAHGWPGNVRQLDDVMHRAVLLARGGPIGPDHLIGGDGAPLGPDTPHPPVAGLVGATVEAVERELILQTLVHCRGNRTSASTILGISVRTMRNKLREFSEAGIAVPAA